MPGISFWFSRFGQLAWTSAFSEGWRAEIAVFLLISRSHRDFVSLYNVIGCLASVAATVIKNHLRPTRSSVQARVLAPHKYFYNRD